MATYLPQLVKHYWPDFSISEYETGSSISGQPHTRQQCIHGIAKTIVTTRSITIETKKLTIGFVLHYQIPGKLQTYWKQVNALKSDESNTASYLICNPTDIKLRQSLTNQVKIAELQQVVRYAQTRSCRTAFLNRHLGITYTDACGHCDNCQPTYSIWTQTDLGIIAKLTKLRNELARTYRVDQNRILTPIQVCLIAVHQPSTTADFLKLPGIGTGWIEKWYNMLSTEIKKGAIYGINFTTAH